METAYRSFSIMPHTSSRNSSKSRRRSNAASSRRSSTDSESKYWESGNSSGTALAGNGSSSSFFAMSASFINSLPQAHHADTAGNRGARAADSSGTFVSKRWAPKKSPSRDDRRLDISDRQSSEDKSRPVDHWTAPERAEYVAKDKRLHALFLAEVERSGVVTAAGYRAVHQKFLYSDVVDQEMDSCRFEQSSLRQSRPNVLRNSLFGGLVKSAFTNDNCDQQMIKKRSSGSNASQELQHDADLDNLAPRRTQLIRLTPEQRGEIRGVHQQQAPRRKTESFLASIENMDNDHGHDQSMSTNEDSFRASLEKLDAGSGWSHRCTQEEDESSSMIGPLCSRDMPIMAANQNVKARSSCRHERQDSNDSLVLQDIFDGVDGSEVFSSITSETLTKKKKTNASSGLVSTSSTTFSRHDTLSSRFSDINFDPETTDVDTNDNDMEDENDENQDEDLKLSVYSYTDKCGWWPEKKEDDNSSTPDEQFAESFISSGEGEDSFLPWPGLSNSGRARAA